VVTAVIAVKAAVMTVEMKAARDCINIPYYATTNRVVLACWIEKRRNEIYGLNSLS
jgi:hypothetical protein